MAQIRFVFVYAIPRTGSTHLLHLLRGSARFTVRYEQFHFQTVGLSVKEILALAAVSAGAIADDRSLCLWRRENPTPTLETLYACNGGEPPLMVKLFPGHLQQARIESELLARDDVLHLVLTRRPIESIISGVKSKSLQRFQSFDTTAFKPELTAEDFVGRATDARNWYAWLDDALARRSSPVARISYDREINGLPDKEVLSRALEKLEALGLPRGVVPERVHSIPRQDREPHYRNRIANWVAFEAQVRANPEHAALLDWAEAPA